MKVMKTSFFKKKSVDNYLTKKNSKILNNNILLTIA